VAYKTLNNKGWLGQIKSIVLGGGGAELPGSAELIAKIFGISTRTGYVSGFENLDDNQRSSRYGSVMGLLKWQNATLWQGGTSTKENKRNFALSNKRGETTGQSGHNIIKWFKDFF
jgi:cell division ATPase FtsA